MIFCHKICVFLKNQGVKFGYTEKTELSSGFCVRRYGTPEGEEVSREVMNYCNEEFGQTASGTQNSVRFDIQKAGLWFRFLRGWAWIMQ